MNLALRTLISASALVAAAAFIAGAPNSATAKELIYGSWSPQVTYTNRVLYPKIFKEIADETKGEIKWKVVAGGQIVGPKDSFNAPGDGLVAAAFGIAIYQPNLVPALNTIYSTLVFEGDSTVGSPAAMETFYMDCPQCLAEFKKLNLVGIGGWTTTQYHLACREPITKVEQLKGLRIRGTGGPAQLWQLAGAVPISSTLPESLTLLQRGGLDCMHTTYGWLQTFSYGDFAKFVTDYPMSMSGPAIGMMINRKVWDGFTDEQKKIHLRKAAYVTAAEGAIDFGSDQQKLLKLVEAKKGVKLVKAEPAGFAALVDKFDGVQRASVIDAAKKFGVEDPGKIIDAYKKNIAKWQKLAAGVGYDADKLDKLVWDNIYSKIDLGSL